MNPDIEQLLEALNSAHTSAEIANVTIKLLRWLWD